MRHDDGAPEDTRTPPAATPPAAEVIPAALVAEGQRVFRFDTFGDEKLWTDTLRLHEVVERSVDPTTALEVGLKVDAEVVPPGLLERVDLKSPATTVALLEMTTRTGRTHRSSHDAAPRPLAARAVLPRRERRDAC